MCTKRELTKIPASTNISNNLHKQTSYNDDEEGSIHAIDTTNNKQQSAHTVKHVQRSQNQPLKTICNNVSHN